MGIIGKKVKSEGLGLSGLATLLSSQKDFVSSALPAGLAGSLGFGNMFSDKNNIVSNVASNVDTEVKSKNWMPWIIRLLAVLGVLFFWNKYSGDIKDDANNVKDSAVAVVDSASNVAENSASAIGEGLEKLGAFFKRKLPNGIELTIPEMGVKNNLIKFIEDGSAEVSKDNWLNFDRINFATGSTSLTDESMEQIANIAEILKAYPDLKLKIGGYTDNTGNSQSNLKLSDNRVVAVIYAIVAKGVEVSRLTAEGYGDLHPVASNDTKELRTVELR